MSKFQIGDRVQWQPTPTQDFGTATGMQYTPASHLGAWAWKYTIWLDAASPSHAWIKADSAWEFDLESLLTPTQSPATLEIE